MNPEALSIDNLGRRGSSNEDRERETSQTGKKLRVSKVWKPSKKLFKGVVNHINAAGSSDRMRTRNKSLDVVTWTSQEPDIGGTVVIKACCYSFNKELKESWKNMAE